MPLPVQVVPQGIESVNGSDVNMGCATPVGTLPGINLTICGNFGSGAGVISYLVDGNSPAIDTSASDWASQLVTVRKNDATRELQDHVVLTFGFDTAVSLTSIELDLFLCPELNIGAPFISVYGDNSSTLVYSPASDLINNYTPNKISCDYLSTVTIFLFNGDLSYHQWHIIVSFLPQSNIEWVHVGEVRLLGSSADSTPIPDSSSISGTCIHVTSIMLYTHLLEVTKQLNVWVDLFSEVHACMALL